jgi:hypothetical protein
MSQSFVTLFRLHDGHDGYTMVVVPTNLYILEDPKGKELFRAVNQLCHQACDPEEEWEIKWEHKRR